MKRSASIVLLGILLLLSGSFLAPVSAADGDGSGTMDITPVTAIRNSSYNFRLDFTATEDLAAGAQVQTSFPTGSGGWTAPQASSSAIGGYVNILGGTCTGVTVDSIAPSGQDTLVTVNATCAPGQTFSYSYYGVHTPDNTLSWDFTTSTKNSGGDFTLLSAQPVVTLLDAPTYTVFFEAGINGTLLGETIQSNIPAGGSTTAVMAVPATGYHFIGWTGADGFAPTMVNPLTVTNVTTDMTIYANFSPDDAEAAANLATARYNHTATLLPGGKILIAGGYGNIGSVYASAELYDPATGTATATGSLAAARQYHTATLLRNGKVLLVGGSGSGGAFVAAAELYDPATGQFTTTGSLDNPRYNHTATLLSDGRVLIVGGNAKVYPYYSELYDPSSGTFTVVGSLSAMRQFHTATLLPNGKVLIIGGWDNNYLSNDALLKNRALNDAEIFDPDTNRFTVATGTMTFARYRHTATLLPDGTVLVSGGMNPKASPSYIDSIELYYPDAETFIYTGMLSTARYNHSATLLPNGKVLIAGGANKNPVANGELYDPVSSIVSAGGNLTTARHSHTATLLPSGAIFIAGGYNGGPLGATELYEPAIGMVTTAEDLLTARARHTATLLPTGKVLIAGGNNSEGHQGGAALYDPVAGTFTDTGALNLARSSHTATLLANGTVLIAGGLGSDGYLAGAELYDPTNGSFTATGTTLATARANHSATLLPDGKVLIVGGSNGAALNSAELFDPLTGSFAPTGSLATPRFDHTATLLANGKVFIAGGSDGGMPLSSAELYDPLAGTFATVENSLAVARTSHSATLLPNRTVLLIGGIGSSGNYLASAERYDPATGVFVAGGTLATARANHSATLLVSGRILVAGGMSSSDGYLAGTELYDPALNTFSDPGSMAGERGNHSATLLPSGKVLVAGGISGSGSVAGAELYDPGLGFDDAWRPTIASIVFDAGNPNRLVVTGSGFTGKSEAAGGSCNSSATNFPLLRLQRLDSGQVQFIPADAASDWTDNSLNTAVLSNLPMGHYLATLLANAIPSQQQFIVIDAVLPDPPDNGLPPTISGVPAATIKCATPYSFLPTATNAIRFTISNKPSWAVFNSETGALTGSPAFTDAGSYAGIVITAVNPHGSAALPSFSITASVDPPVITTASLSTVTTGSYYSPSLAVTGGVTPYIWTISAGSLPGGLLFYSATGIIRGTPTNPGVFPFTVTITDSRGASSSRPLVITVSSVCAGSPVCLGGTLAFPDFVSAYQLAANNATLQLRDISFSSDFLLNRDVRFSLGSGYDNSYTTNAGTTTLLGTLRLVNGSVKIVDKLRFR